MALHRRLVILTGACGLLGLASGISQATPSVSLSSVTAITWSDGTSSTTTCNASGCAGSIHAADNTTFTGSDTFTSTVTVGPSVFSTTASYASIIKGVESAVAVASVTAIRAISFMGVDGSSFTHVIDFNFTLDTDVDQLDLRINNDTGANYDWAITTVTSGNQSTKNAGRCSIFGTADNMRNGLPMAGRIIIKPMPTLGRSNIALSWTSMAYDSTGAEYTADTGSCYYHPSPSSRMSSIQLSLAGSTSDSTLTGYAVLKAEVLPMGY